MTLWKDYAQTCREFEIIADADGSDEAARSAVEAMPSQIDIP